MMTRKTKRKPLKYSDLRENMEDIEHKKFEVLSRTSEMGRSAVYFNCCFCGVEIKAFIWSLCGGGKRCTNCKAIYSQTGDGYQWKEENDNAKQARATK